MRDNAPAFPQHHVDNDPRNAEPFHYVDGGMTLRDYFAAKAMDGFNKHMVDYGWGPEILEAHAKQAYAVADAMMEARK